MTKLRTAALIFLFAGMPAGGARAATESSPFIPKEFHKTAGEYILPSELEIRVTPGAKAKLWLFADSLKGTDISIRLNTIKVDNAEVVIAGPLEYKTRTLEMPPRPEGYLLDITNKGFLLMAKDELGIQWGLLRLRATLNMKRRSLPALLVRDWPDLTWRGVHLFMPKEDAYDRFARFVDEVLLPHHFNTVVLEINYGFAFKSHPEVSEPDSPDAAYVKRVSDLLLKRGMRVIPEFNCLGHQSWQRRPTGLLRAHPDLDETPRISAEDQRLYSRSWCPRHPKLPPILYRLWSELIGAFRSTHFHIGMDEVFFIAEKTCTRCGASAPWEVFAAAAAQYHAFFQGKGNTVLMWGDRLIDASTTKYSKYESSETDTWKSIEYLPRDIIICDWHYGPLEEYPSLKMFQEQGFRVLACPWRKPDNVQSLWTYAQKVRTDRFLGFLATTWIEFKELSEALFEGKGDEKAMDTAACLKLVGRLCWQGKEKEASPRPTPPSAPPP